MNMSDSGFRRWVGLGALASVMMWGGACQKGGEQRLDERPEQPGRTFPEAGREFEGRANDAQDVESFGQEQQPPATGGSGQPMQQTQSPRAPASPDDAQRMGPEEAAGAQGRQGGIGAPGYSTPQETGTPGTGVTGGDTSGMGGTSAPGTRTEGGGAAPAGSPPEKPGSDLSPGTPIGDPSQQNNQR
jgi:hypothetical protein